MTLSLLFWVLYILVLVFGIGSNWPVSDANRKPLGSWLLLFILIGLLGWQSFGPAIHK